MNDFKISDEDVLDNISDDIIYFRELIEREKKVGLNFLKESHLGRLAFVLIYNCIEAHRDYIGRKLALTNSTIHWGPFFDSPLKPIMESLISSKIVNFRDVDEVKNHILGLKALRDFISHGLVNESANCLDKKLSYLKNSGLLKNPTKLTIDDVENALDFDHKLTTLFGMSRALYEK